MPIRLRPSEPADDAFVARLRERSVAGEFNWFEDRDEGPPPASVERMIVTLDDGTPIGNMSSVPRPYGPNPSSRAWNIGITLLEEHRGRGHGALAQRMLADHLFATSDANRVEATTDVENIAEQRALERAGFVREGVLRGAQFRQGQWHDLVLYARLRTDPPSA